MKNLIQRTIVPIFCLVILGAYVFVNAGVTKTTEKQIEIDNLRSEECVNVKSHIYLDLKVDNTYEVVTVGRTIVRICKK